MRNLPALALVSAGVGFAVLMAACEPYKPYTDEEREIHPLGVHPFVAPPTGWEWTEGADPSSADATTTPDGEPAPSEGRWERIGHVSAGIVTGVALDQPIAFTHYRHVTTLGMDCQYCHVYARESNYAGVPPVELCMGCHTHVLTDSPEIMKLTAFWESGEPVPWQKVHDLPDFVHFAHKRHVRAGVQCTECHGQVPLMGRWPDGDPAAAEVMVREAPLQMGWCLDCHAEHPSIDENYGDDANVRRAELKDCWTCHK